MPDVIDTTAREDGEPEPAASSPPPEPGAAVERAPAPSPGDVAVASAAEHALAMPGVPGRDEFLSLAMQARMLSLSGAAPKAVRESPYVAFHVAMVGRDLGISPSAALELIDVIDGRNGPQLSLSPQLLNGQVRRLGLGEVVRGRETPTSCEAIAVGPGGRDRRCRLRWPEHVEDCECDILGSSTFTWEDARIAGLVGPECQPGAHVKNQTRGGRQGGNSYKVCGCNQGYITYPKRMLWWRASGYLTDDVFPEAGLGLYTAEELGAVVDEHGRALDVASVELPPGYEPPAVGRGRTEPGQPADPDDLWDLQARLLALPEEQQLAWRAQKAQQDRLKGIPTYMLPASAVRLAKSLVSGLESAAKKQEPDYDPASAAEAVKLSAFSALCEVICGWTGGEPDADPPSPPEDPEPTPDQPESAPEAEPAPETPADAQAPTGDAVADSLAAPSPPRPTVRDADEARRNIEASVEKMSLAEVRKDLAELGLPTTGGAKTLRPVLVGALVAQHMEDSQ